MTLSVFILSATRIPPGQISELRAGEFKITMNCGKHACVTCDTFMMHVFSSFLPLFEGICYHFQHFLAPFEDFLAHGVPKWSQVTKKRRFRANPFAIGTLNLVLFGANGTKRRPRWSKKRTRKRNCDFLKTVKNSSVFDVF